MTSTNLPEARFAQSGEVSIAYRLLRSPRPLCACREEWSFTERGEQLKGIDGAWRPYQLAA